MNIHARFEAVAALHEAEQEKDFFLGLLKTRLDNGSITQLCAAEALSRFVHGDILRNNDRPYIDHVFRVAAKGKTANEKIARLLHDVPEESLKYNRDKYLNTAKYRAPVTIEDIANLGFAEEVVIKIAAMTKTGPYLNYVMGLSLTDAMQEKRDDIEDNINDNPDPDRIKLYLLADFYLAECQKNPLLRGSDIRDFAMRHGMFDQALFDRYYEAPSAPVFSFQPA